MTTAVTETTQTTALTGATSMGGVGLDSRDIMVPMLALRQNSYVKDYMEDFKPGDIILRPDNTCLAAVGEEVLFVPVGIESAWAIVDTTSKMDRTIGYEPFDETTRNRDLAWTTTEGKFRRDRVFNVHILLLNSLKAQAQLLKDVAAGEPVDPDDFMLPIKVQFKRAGFQSGKLLNTHFEMCKALGNQSPAGKVYSLKAAPKSNDDGKWFAFDVTKITDAKKKKTPKDYMDAANQWVDTLKTRTVVSASSEEDHAIPTAEVVTNNGPTSDDIPF